MMDEDRTVTIDMVIKSDQVYDSETRTLKKQDISVSQGKIAAISGEMMTDEETKMIDVNGCVVAPRLIGMHYHIYPVSPEPVDGLPTIRAEAHVFRSSVTTAVDAGTYGCRDFWRLKEEHIDKSKLRIFIFINIAQGGMVSFPSEQKVPGFHPRVAAAIARDADCVMEIRTAHYWVGVPVDSKHPVWASMNSTILTGELYDKPVMIDSQPNPPERTYKELILKKLKRGDIHAHVYTQQFPIVDEQGKVNDIMFEARKRGVIFDLGHNAGSFQFRSAVSVYEQGFYPDTISTGLYTDSMNEPVFDLLHIMSKCLTVGMPAEEVLHRTTKRPAEIIGHPELGNPRVGGMADIAVLKVRNGEFGFSDSSNTALPGIPMFECLLTVRNGEIVYNPMAYGMPYWEDAAEPYWHAPGVLS